MSASALSDAALHDEAAAAHELGGRAELTFASEGLRAEIAFPLG